MSDAKKTAPAASALDAATISGLAGAIAPTTLSAERLASMRGRIMAGIADATRVIRAGDGEWQELLPGITIKTLHVDREQGTQTSLWRLAAGARIPRHPHSKDEECLVLEGSITHDGETYRQGDFLHTRPGLRHKEFVAPEGALLMIRSERIPSALLLKLAAHLSP
jgi:anti-sigma factor ChrR (cupin superfamily)